MRPKPAADDITRAALIRLAALIEAERGVETGTEPDDAAESLAHQLTTEVADDDLEAVVHFLSNALDRVKAKMRDAGKACTALEEPCESNYWLG